MAVAGGFESADDTPTREPVIDYDGAIARIEDAILGEPGLYSLDQLAERAGLTGAEIREVWKWLGMPLRSGGRPHFTETDVSTLEAYRELITNNNFDHALARSLVRATGYATERLTTWHVEAVVEYLMRAHNLDDTAARLRAAELLQDIVPAISKQVDQVWRRQFAEATRRNTIEVVMERAGRDIGTDFPLHRAVGFCDVVGFTARTAHLDYSSFPLFLEELSFRTRDVIAALGGRLIKTIGDAALFVADDIETGIEVGLELATELRSKTDVEVRVSVVWTSVLGRYGDVFGPGVNLASRICHLAAPSQLLVDSLTAELLKDNEKYVLTPQPAAEVRGLGPMQLVEVTRAY